MIGRRGIIALLLAGGATAAVAVPEPEPEPDEILDGGSA